MCTVVVRVPAEASQPTRVLAIRDEDPTRPWNPLGPWWPDTHPGVDGVRDARAGGAWLATHSDAGRLAVLLNVGGPIPNPGLASRGEAVLDAVSGRTLTSRRTLPYNLVSVAGSQVSLTLSDGDELETQPLAPGVHMLVNSVIPNDPSFARVPRWLEEFRATAPGDNATDWFGHWLELLARSAEMPPTDDAAIIRDNRPWGIPTFSLLFCTATVTATHVDASYVEFPRPGHWSPS